MMGQTCNTFSPAADWHRLAMGFVVCPNCGAVYWLVVLRLAKFRRTEDRPQTK